MTLCHHTLNTLVTALVHSRLDYCNVVFAGLPACDIQRLVSPQRSRTSGCRFIATRPRDFSATRPPLAASETARRVQAVYDGTSLLVRRRTILPLADLITPSAAATVRPGLRSAASSTVAVPRTTSSLGDRSFPAAGPRAWNKLPPPLRRVYSAATFKRQLKTFLYNHAFNWHVTVRRPCCVSALTSP